VTGLPGKGEEGPRPESWAEVVEVIRELTETLAPQPPAERMERLVAALTEHYRSRGAPEPGWLGRARELSKARGKAG
jgi:hypothetical protein